MWGRWRSVFKSIFSTTATREVEKEQQPIKRNSEIKMKMKYQYPTEKAFRFPLIPDESRAKKMSDIPAFQRRSKDELSQDNHTNNQGKLGGKQQIENDYYQKPFKPSQVPSPIYGYHKRNKAKEIDKIPIFIRNQQADEIESTHSQRLEMENDNRKQEEHSENKIPEREKKIKEKNETTDRSVVETIEANTRNKKKEHQHNKKTNRMRRVKKQKQSATRSKEKNNQTPYNVMMTPGDKTRMQERGNRKKGFTSTSVRKSHQDDSLPYHLLNDPIQSSSEDQLWVQNQQVLLERTLKHFNVQAKVVNATQGPSVTRFEVQPEIGVKVSKVRNLSDDIKLNMAAKDIRIEAPIPGKNTIGIEIPNLKSQMVGLREIFETKLFQKSTSPLTIGLGLDVEGLPLITNISKMPHGLIAGATGSGKSVCINTILISLLYKSSHEDVKFLLIDPKMVELAPYNGLPHLVAPVITDVKAATAALKWAVGEMEERYEKFVREGVRDINRYNEKVSTQHREKEKMAYMIIVIDELADLMMVSPQEVEDSICRIAQKARACGIHLLLATQRPSVDVITGLIKANIPTRIAFSVSSQVDSRTIIDTNGAERLLGKGDMLFIENGSGKSIRIQGAFVSDEEIERVTDDARSVASPNYLFNQDQLLQQKTTEDVDELLEDVIYFVVKHNSASTSLLQRQFRIGYNRAARLIETLESMNIISGQNGSKPREVLISNAELEGVL